MCGIAGVFVAPGHQVDRAGLERMTQRLAHRGPDGAGVWLAADGRIGLGHRRLSIIDVSPAGAQPMTSASGRYLISFNGEIYNFTELRQRLARDGAAFRGHSDTEVALAAFERWGVEPSIARFNGMFAFAVWDSRERQFYLVRDRLGIKPLYYRQTRQELVFASELRALHAYAGASLPLSPEGMASYFRFGYIPGSTAIFSGVQKLEPGAMLSGQGPDVLAEKKYWSVEGAALAGLRDPYVGTEEECVQELERQLRSAVRRQMVSDVPLGAFLSGGIDSSTVTALMQAESPRPVRSFSIGFEDQVFNEAPHAARIAAHLGTDHTELYVTDREAREVIPRLAEIYDEPLADISQIPTSLLAQLTRKHVTVSLSGDGGDELFAGYDRYLLVPRVWKRLRVLPHSLRSVIAAVLRRVAPGSWDTLIDGLGRILSPRWVPALPGQKLHKVATVLDAPRLIALYEHLVALWPNPELLTGHASAAAGTCAGLSERINPYDSQMCWDMRNYLAEDLLTKVDRATMYVGLEARVPLLDHTLVEHAWRIPVSLKLRDGSGKWILKRVLERHVPRHLFERPKMGFSVPIDDWLRGPLREWAGDLLARERLTREGLLNVHTVRQTWEQHLARRVNRGTALWAVLMFELWRERMRQWA